MVLSDEMRKALLAAKAARIAPLKTTLSRAAEGPAHHLLRVPDRLKQSCFPYFL